MVNLRILLILSSVLVWLQEARGAEDIELEELVDTYVDTFRWFLNGSTAEERLKSLTEDAWKFASLSEDMGRVLVNGSLGYTDGDTIRLRREFYALFCKISTLYDDVPEYLDYMTYSANDHGVSSLFHGPCFARTMDNFDILTGNTKRILLQVAAPFKHLATYYYDGSFGSVPFVLKRASKNQAEDLYAWNMVARCGWQYASSTDRVCDDYGEVRTRTVECALEAIDRIMGPTCEETDNATLMEFYGCRSYEDACAKWNLTSVATNRCFHNALIRYSNYSTKVYDSFIGSLGTYLLMELDGFGFCRHIVETKKPIANFTERRQEVVTLVQGIAQQLLRGKKVLEDEGAGKCKTWTELAQRVAHAGIDFVAEGADFPYPSPDRAVAKYEEVGEAIIKRIRANRFNTETYRYEIIVYTSGSGPEEVCLINSNDDVVQGNYRNVNYLVSRVEVRLTNAVTSRIQKDNATIRASFGKSSKRDLCERLRDVETELKYELTGQAGFRTMLVTKCARKFVWYELAWQHFRAAWSTSDHQIFVINGNYDAQCVSVVLIP